jgi:hypothetical protein
VLKSLWNSNFVHTHKLVCYNSCLLRQLKGIIHLVDSVHRGKEPPLILTDVSPSYSFHCWSFIAIDIRNQ